MRWSAKLLAALFGLLLIATVKQAFAQANFYEGKTIRLVVGFSAGGGYDAYTRTIARHFGKHIPAIPPVLWTTCPARAV
jgi:tripartite-type tricarboxylate transporter receptor subunit TctC